MRERAAKPKRKAYTVVAYGDSWTYGSVANGWHEAKEAGYDWELIHGSWFSQLRRWLMQMDPETVIYNQGMPGWKSYQGRDHFERRVAALDPDLLILNFAINDWTNKIPLHIYKTAMDQIMLEAKRIGCQCVVWTSGPVAAASEKSYGFESPMQDSSFPHRFEEYNDTLRNLAAEHRVILADAERVIRRLWESGTEISGWFYDAIHFTQQGHDTIFQCLRDALALDRRVNKKGRRIAEK
ncbi:SGNH/GDSL hydrolase family protein [Paenibacillus ginsengarvi]|uniref:SGNH/GDSL hydrolase family protein n=1 Tax=Paenibacillus ginsengarvi TaxID=400777 RepID=A0A3B0B688_9BACL|nr:SGNH/GDSL hydrolase family protein [Paenibacillus ginsengarvi]RKN66057.1 SGNH/GDSL hydrolase family protein [Paenibacillus ginsengarvi]